MVLDPAYDSSSGKSPLSYTALKKLKWAIHDSNLCDTWRLLNPQGKYYSLYSAPYATYCRLDYISISPDLLDCSPTTHLDPILLSDHTPC